MDPRRPERPGMELLETNEEPGRLEQLATAALQRRAVRVAGLVGLALLAGFGVSRELTDDDRSSAASSSPQDESQPDRGQKPGPRDPESYLPPPWVISEDVDWQVLGRLDVDLESPVYVVSFVAVNRSSELRTPAFKAVGRFEGRPGFRFSAACTGPARHRNGEPRRLRVSVLPGEKVFLRCVDTMKYSGDRPELDARSLEIRALPYDGTGREPTILHGDPGTSTSHRTGLTGEPPLIGGATGVDG